MRLEELRLTVVEEQIDAELEPSRRPAHGSSTSSGSTPAPHFSASSDRS
jgi:hypothetical protein